MVEGGGSDDQGVPATESHVPTGLGGEPMRVGEQYAGPYADPVQMLFAGFGFAGFDEQVAAEPSAHPPDVERGGGEQATVGEQAPGVEAVVGQFAAEQHPTVGQV